MATTIVGQRWKVYVYADSTAIILSDGEAMALSTVPGFGSNRVFIIGDGTSTVAQLVAALATETTQAAYTADAAPQDADEVVGFNSGSAFAKIRTTWTTIKAFLKTWLDGFLAPKPNWTSGSVGEIMNIAGTDNSTLSLPTGGVWFYSVMWQSSSPPYGIIGGAPQIGIEAGGTQIKGAGGSGYLPIANIWRIS